MVARTWNPGTWEAQAGGSGIQDGAGDRAGDMAPWLRALVALVEDLSLVLSTHLVAHNVCNSSSRGSDIFFGPLWALGPHTVYDTHTHGVKNKSLK